MFEHASKENTFDVIGIGASSVAHYQHPTQLSWCPTSWSKLMATSDPAISRARKRLSLRAALRFMWAATGSNSGQSVCTDFFTLVGFMTHDDDDDDDEDDEDNDDGMMMAIMLYNGDGE